MACPPSARAEQRIPRKDTSYSLEGTLAHSIAEAFLNTLLDINCEALPSWDEMSQNLKEAEGMWSWSTHHQEAARSIDVDFWETAETVYNGYVVEVYGRYLGLKAEGWANLIVEAELKLNAYIPEGFGSSDAVIITEDTLEVFDLKYGKGVKVSAHRNTQMMCYGLGALMGLAELTPVKTVYMTIVQPRLNHVSFYQMSAEALYLWAKEILKPAAEVAFAGEGEYTPGEHCRFCSFLPQCFANRVRAEIYMSSAEHPEALSNEELGQVLPVIDQLRKWADSVEAYAADLAAEGTLPGYKLVEGRSTRKITDTEGAYAALIEASFEPGMIMKAPELKTLTELEKMLGKGGKGILAPFITKTPGKPTLARESDPRPAINNAKEDFKDTTV